MHIGGKLVLVVKYAFTPLKMCIDIDGSLRFALKASANKIKTLKILIQTPQHLTYLG